MIIRSCNAEDITSICNIYNHHIDKSVATFEENILQAGKMKQRIQSVKQNFPWLVCEQHGVLVGFAYATEWKKRSAYKNSAETTVYIKDGCYGNGYGTTLYQRLIDDLKQTSLHTVMAGITLPNDASVSLHQRLGFEKVAHFKQVGRKFGEWLDVGYWQLML